MTRKLQSFTLKSGNKAAMEVSTNFGWVRYGKGYALRAQSLYSRDKFLPDGTFSARVRTEEKALVVCDKNYNVLDTVIHILDPELEERKTLLSLRVSIGEVIFLRLENKDQSWVELHRPRKKMTYLPMLFIPLASFSLALKKIKWSGKTGKETFGAIQTTYVRSVGCYQSLLRMKYYLHGKNAYMVEVDNVISTLFGEVHDLYLIQYDRTRDLILECRSLNQNSRLIAMKPHHPPHFLSNATHPAKMNGEKDFSVRPKGLVSRSFKWEGGSIRFDTSFHRSKKLIILLDFLSDPSFTNHPQVLREELRRNFQNLGYGMSHVEALFGNISPLTGLIYKLSVLCELFEKIVAHAQSRGQTFYILCSGPIGFILPRLIRQHRFSDVPVAFLLPPWGRTDHQKMLAYWKDRFSDADLSEYLKDYAKLPNPCLELSPFHFLEDHLRPAQWKTYRIRPEEDMIAQHASVSYQKNVLLRLVDHFRTADPHTKLTSP